LAVESTAAAVHPDQRVVVTVERMFGSIKFKKKPSIGSTADK
jgi:hypothetical protein